MFKRQKTPLRIRAVCRGEGTGYIAIVSREELKDLCAVARTSDGCRIPCDLYSVKVPTERALLAAQDEYAWIAVLPLLNRAVIVSFTHGNVLLEECVYYPNASKIASRLITQRSPEVAAVMRGFEQRRGAGRSLLFIREGLPADDGMVSWRMQAEFPTDDAALTPQLKAFDPLGDELDAKVVCMEDHVVPFSRDEGLAVRLVWFSCLLPEYVGSFFVEASLADDDSLRAFACMNEPRARGMLADIRHRMDGAPVNGWYEEWFANARVTEAELARQTEACTRLSEGQRPFISIVMPVYRPKREYLEEALASVLAQSYDCWELVIANASGDYAEVDGVLELLDDKRIRVLTIENRSIAQNTNVAIDATQGDYVAFLDHDDVLEPDALWRYVEALRGRPMADLLYCDEDHLRDNHVHAPAFKTFPNYGKLYTHNYVTHFLMVSRFVLDQTERSGEEVSGAQDYDLTLKAFEVARDVVHVARVLYHWREHEASTSGGGDQKPYAHEAGRRALAAHLERRGIDAEVHDGPLVYTYRVRYVLPKPAPAVSIVIPTRDHGSLLRTCVESILSKSTYSNYEIILVENGSEKDETFLLYDELVARDARVKMVVWEVAEGQGFNYSELVNYGVAHSSGELVMLLNNDTEVIEPAWIEEMAGCLMRPEVGVVGAKLLFYDGLIQHVGMVANPVGDNCHVCQNLTRSALGAGFAAAMPGDYSMVTGACQLTRRKLFDELGGYDEGLAVGYNDSDYCLRVREQGWSVAMAPYALLYHREFSSRGREVTDVRLRARLMQEKARIIQRHPDFYAQGDPALNNNLNGFSAYFDL